MNIYTSCFVGIPLPESYTDEFKDLLKKLKHTDSYLSTVYPETPHITLFYLAKQSETALDDVKRIVKKHIHLLRGSTIESLGLNTFTPSFPRIVFMDVKVSKELNTIHKRLEAELKLFAALDNKNNFHPHITLARIKSGKGRASFAKKHETLRLLMQDFLWTFPVTEICVYGVDASKIPEHQEILTKIPVV